MNSNFLQVMGLVTGWIAWVGFAIVFFYSGLFFTEWLLDDGFGGGWRWILVAVFPLLVPAFFVVNRRYGCASGACSIKRGGDRVSRLPLA